MGDFYNISALHLATKKAQEVAAAHAASLRKVCKEVVAKKGAASSG